MTTTCIDNMVQEFTSDVETCCKIKKKKCNSKISIFKLRSRSVMIRFGLQAL